jgi:hypothetical protein
MTTVQPAYGLPEYTQAEVWADGFGVWHARVPRTDDKPRYAAFQSIRAELVARGDIGPMLTDTHGMSIMRVKELDRGTDSLVFAEYWKDGS